MAQFIVQTTLPKSNERSKVKVSKKEQKNDTTRNKT